MQKWQFLIHNSTLETFIWSVIWKTYFLFYIYNWYILIIPVVFLRYINAPLFLQRTHNKNNYLRIDYKNGYLILLNLTRLLRIPLWIWYCHLCIEGHLWLHLLEEQHSCMPSPSAPDPIRVQPCVCCLFWTNRNSKWKYLLLLKPWWQMSLL